MHIKQAQTDKDHQHLKTLSDTPHSNTAKKHQPKQVENPPTTKHTATGLRVL